jgi:hypothetical protein
MKLDHNIVFLRKKRQFVRWKLIKIAENCDHGINRCLQDTYFQIHAEFQDTNVLTI